MEAKKMKNKELKDQHSEFMRKTFSSLVARLRCIQTGCTVSTMDVDVCETV